MKVGRGTKKVENYTALKRLWIKKQFTLLVIKSKELSNVGVRLAFQSASGQV